MKKPLLLCAFINIIISAFSQEPCKDMIYTVEDAGILFNCCIREIIDNNLVIYLKDGEIDSVAAYAVNRRGQYFELIRQRQADTARYHPTEYDPNRYMGFSYEYYHDLYKKAKIKQGVGSFLLIAGVGLGIGGIGKMIYHIDDWNSGGVVGVVLFVSGVGMFGIGMPLLITGTVKKSSSRKAMQIIQNQQKLTVGINNYGVGMVYKF